MTTIKEIAELAGVSRGTVDRVLNNRGMVNAATADRVREIAEKLSYKPNKAGIALASQKKRLKLGVVIFSNSEAFFKQVIEGIEKKAADLEGYNCSVLLKQVPFDEEKQLSAIDDLVEEGINGLAISPYNSECIRIRINQLCEQGIPVITLNTDIENSKRLAYVGSNYYKSGEAAAGLMHLITQGDVFVGIVIGSSNILCHTERVAGFKAKVEELESNMHICCQKENLDSEVESYEVTASMLREHPEINAIYFASGGVYGGCRAVIASGRQKEIKIISHDMVPTTRELLEDGIISATICQHPSQQGSRPLQLLFDYLTIGELPKKECYYMANDIRIKENIEY